MEVESRMSDPPLAACVHCGAEKPRRLISQTSFVLKGGGWYVSDYARRDGSKKSGDGPSSPPPSDGDTKTKTSGGDSGPSASSQSSASADGGGCGSGGCGAANGSCANKSGTS